MGRPVARQDHASVATQYARDIVEGKIPACKWVILSCQQHLNDLEASRDPDYPYEFDHEKANRPVRFIELLPHVEGKWAAKGLKIVLEPWQKYVICSIFGWVKKTDGYRRCKLAYCCVPRKNGKSALSAGIGLYCLIMDNEYGAQVYAGATGREQAAFVFNPAKQMASKTERLATHYGVEVNADSITVLSKNSKFTRLIGNPGDGGSPSCAIVDEYHEHSDSRLFDTMTSGMGARDQPLAFVITTAGFNTAGPCYLLQKDMEKILEGTFVDPTRFAVIYGLDETDDWTSVDSLVKANPNWGISVNAEDAIREQQEAMRAAEKQTLFKTKKLNIWCFARNGYFNVLNWGNCGNAPPIEEFVGHPAVKGLDLAAQEDLAADVTVFQRWFPDQQIHYFIYTKFYVPEATVADPKNRHYQKWAVDGHLIATPGNEIALGLIKNNILADIAEYDVRELDYDKYQATYMKQEIVEETAIEGVEIAQNASTLDIPMKWLRAMINGGRIHHDGNPVMQWCIANTVSTENSREQDFPEKERPESKIDGVSALLSALARVRAVLGELGGGMYQEYTGM